MGCVFHRWRNLEEGERENSLLFLRSSQVFVQFCSKCFEFRKFQYTRTIHGTIYTISDLD